LTDPVRGQAREGVHLGKLISTAELAAAWGVSPQRVRAVADRIPGARKVGRAFVFPEAAKEQKDQVLDSKFRKKS